MAISEARKKANKKWNDENMKTRYDRIQLVVPKGKKEELQEHVSKQGKSLNSYVNEAIEEKMERDNNIVTEITPSTYIEFLDKRIESERKKKKNTILKDDNAWYKNLCVDDDNELDFDDLMQDNTNDTNNDGDSE